MEVQNISMTATVPEDIQISLGALTGEGASLAYNTGVLTPAGTGDSATASDGTVKAPGNTDADANFWSNTADISKYYSLGKIMPASSTNGATIYFTPDANGVGQTVKEGAKYYAANSGLTAENEAGTGKGSGTYKTTLHAFTATEKTSATSITPPTLTASTGWNYTNDDGYYVDIPIWLRTSSTNGAKLSVQAYAIPATTTTGTGESATAIADNDMYKACRVALLEGEGVTVDTTKGARAATEGAAVRTNNILPIADGAATVAEGKTKYDNESILDSANLGTTGRTTTGITTYSSSSLYAVTSLTSNAATYATYTPYSPTVTTDDANIVAQLEKGTGTEYGTPKKLIIRVWLDGEDGQCWNKYAGQDFSINLKFNNESVAS